jgi:hypothetical protein
MDWNPSIKFSARLYTPEFVAQHLPDRPMDAHKGTFGTALIVAGSINYTGCGIPGRKSSLPDWNWAGTAGDSCAYPHGDSGRSARSDLVITASRSGCNQCQSRQRRIEKSR